MHVRGTYFRARRFSRSFDPYGITVIAVIAHDLGKKSPPYMQYINSPRKVRGSVKHALGGSIVLSAILGDTQDERVLMSAVLVAGHHAGLPNLRRVFDEKIPNAEEYLKAIPALSQQEMSLIKSLLKRFPILQQPEVKTPAGKVDSKGLLAYKEMLTRMCFSALVDADFLDTEWYFNSEKSAKRKGQRLSIQQLDNKLQIYMTDLRKNASDTKVNIRRNEVYTACREAAKQPLFFRSLIVPTGLAKTLASIAFALEHAKRFNKKRVIVALPLVNIIDQTAKQYEKVFGEHSVLEHHSQMSYEDDKNETMERAKLAAENWDSYPIIVTTTVELFESMFSNRTSKTRKLHRLSDSVIILDEFQKLPIHVLSPIFKSLHILIEYFNVTVVLCSATPLSFHNSQVVGNMGKPIEIYENRDKLFAEMKRVEYVRIAEPLTISELVIKMREQHQALCIVNTRKDAYKVYRKATHQGENSQKVYHLSNRMCPHHRKKVVEQIKKDLRNKKSILVIATSLVEAGVDLDFSAVFRAMSPLDSIVQAAGRANREGGPETGKVFIFELIGGEMPHGMFDQGTKQTKLLLNQYGVEALHEPWIFEEYFRSLYTLGGDDLLDKYRLRKLEPFEFEEVNGLFRMIDQDTVSVVCRHYQAEGDQLEKLIQSCKEKPYLTKEWYRKAQMYAVSVYQDSRFFKENQERLDIISEGWYIWNGDYDTKTGIMDQSGEGGD
ncbi:CRISPR-associated helicase Cas3' [Paenibacillaceae bacterium]|nr:CRISPR-associated helicase Cas3' [Paenibacillaceae bacterium]